MKKSQVFEVWAPPGAAWSAWVKPVVFAHISSAPAESEAAAADAAAADDGAGRLTSGAATAPWAPPADGATAVVVDLPGATGVWLGLVLAKAGYRPIPLYNACPGPDALQPASLLTLMPAMPGDAPAEALPPLAEAAPPAVVGPGGPTPLDYLGPPVPVARFTPSVSLVDVGPIRAALVVGAYALRRLSLPPGAPPAFLLDARRRTGRGRLVPGRFDNRSVSLPTDFPSANLLLNRGVRRAVLVQRTDVQPQADLAHTLRRWQEAGIAIELKRPDVPGPPVPIIVGKPSGFRRLWHGMLVMAGLRRNPFGGFGGTLPHPSSGSGGWGGSG